MVSATEVVPPASTSDGRFAVFSATVNVSSSMSSSWRVAMRAVPLVCPRAIRIVVGSVPRSSASALPRVTVTGMVNARSSARESVAVTVAGCPSSTRGDGAESVNVAGGCAPRVTVIV